MTFSVPTSLSLNEIRARLAAFADKWTDVREEDAEAKSFWDELFTAYGAIRRQVARFEFPIKKLDGQTGFIDVLWKGKLVVEHKSRGKSLIAARQQGLDYIERLKPADRPRFLVTCDFHLFEVEDLQTGEVTKFTLPEIPAHAEALGFLAGYEPKRPVEAAPVNIAAVERLGELYDAMKAGGYPDHDLQEFLVRILFCLFAEDTGVFEPEAFTDLIANRTAEDGSDLGSKLDHAFQTLDNQLEKRQRALDEALAILPYVNGALFAKRLTMAAMDSKMREALIRCTEFDWSKISPAIFGSLFQGVMDAKERRAAGAHYTGEENILKLIRPLFLDALQAEFTAIKTSPKGGREARLNAFHQKLAKLKFFDPACGCGNFLIIAYRELRRLEIDLLKELHPNRQGVLDISLLSRLNVDQFYGIEIDEFPAQIAKVALWLMDHVMNVELGYAFGQAFTRLPLTKSAHITHGNALQIDWKDVIKPEECSYILGNPPFVGHHYQSQAQKEDQQNVLAAITGCGVLDFVSNWFVKAAAYIQGTPVKAALVATNSITQGEQVGLLWNHLFQRHHIKIHFAHRTFAWASEARGKAHVHVVIIGFGAIDEARKLIFDYPDGSEQPATAVEVPNISPYLVAGPDKAIIPQTLPLCAMPKMSWGNKPTDGGHFILSPEEKDALLRSEPDAAPFVRRYVSGGDFINGIERYCLWLKDAAPSALKNLPLVTQRIEAVRKMRLESKASSTRAFAKFPTLFRQIAQPDSAYLGVPEVSSERREYIPMAYLDADVICSNTLQFVPSANTFIFGVLTSSMHMNWVRTVAGRLESRFRYSNTIVYNTFPWPEPTDAQRSEIEKAAQTILDARAGFPGSTLADLYDPNTMPPALAKAHAALDRAVEKAYRKTPFTSDRERVEYLFSLYEKLVAPLALAAKPRRAKKT